MGMDEREIFDDLVRSHYKRLLELKKRTIEKVGKYPVSDKALLAVAFATAKGELE